ncbi:hypothetical protein [Methanoregula sp.]|uniref:hypothetical protein n=1 Tax=Methanoregula sp. TaxID=2052170 RepID=UPI0026192C89|nr:hypothetical protein [Methanoregula sp.]MDD5144132.1 hypothetical protein [Methanoregula sp.]
MNTGIIMIGLSLILLSVGLISSPASAALPDEDCGSGVLVPGSPQGTIGTGTGMTSGTTNLPIKGTGTVAYGHTIPMRS